jgi:hypothetical protein
VIKNPFAPSAKRLKKMYGAAWILASFFTAIIYILTKQSAEEYDHINFRIFQTVAGSSVAASICIMLWILQRFRKFNLSSEIKK